MKLASLKYYTIEFPKVFFLYINVYQVQNILYANKVLFEFDMFMFQEP